MNYFKIHGREKYEIESWLKTKNWYYAFRDNVQNEILFKYKDENGNLYIDDTISKEIDNALDEVISGSLDKKTISSAFSWADTKEGTTYWAKKEYQFLKWYFAARLQWCGAPRPFR